MTNAQLALVPSDDDDEDRDCIVMGMSECIFRTEEQAVSIADTLVRENPKLKYGVFRLVLIAHPNVNVLYEIPGDKER